MNFGSRDPRRCLIASSALRDGATLREACRLSGLSYGTVNRIKNDLRRSGAALPERAPEERLRPDLSARALSPVGRRLSAAILRALDAQLARDEEPETEIGAQLRLTRTERAVLDVMLRCAPRVASRERFYAEAYDGRIIHDKNLDVMICRLRQKLRDRGVFATIETHVGIGYSISREDRDKITAPRDDHVALPPLPHMIVHAS